MTAKEIIETIDKFFSDTTRSIEQTREGLEEIIEHLEILRESLPEE